MLVLSKRQDAGFRESSKFGNQIDIHIPSQHLLSRVDVLLSFTVLYGLFDDFLFVCV